jgi:hypothetical protein
MIIAFTGVSFKGSAPSYPPNGTLLSSHCSGYSAQNAGPETYTDANGVEWTEQMFTTWQELADGYGGSYWSSLGNNSSDTFSSCWYPYGYCLSSDSGENAVSWDACGSSGSFAYASYANATYADGYGGSYGSGGGMNYGYPNGTIIYQSGVDDCCKVKFDGGSSYYTDDQCGSACPSAGYWISDGCASSSGTDASGTYFDGAWIYGSYYTDGSCGAYFTPSGENANGCYYPNGWKFDYTPYSNSLHWQVSDSGAMVQAEGDFTYSSGWSSSAVSDGAGGTFSDGYSWSATFGDLIANGQYFDALLGQYWDYYIYYDGGSGYYAVQYPTP